MPIYLSPGVYIEEFEAESSPSGSVIGNPHIRERTKVDRDAQSLARMSQTVAAFVGIAQQGPFGTPTLITSWRQFRATFGDFVSGTYLAPAVFGFLENGGERCYVVRIGGSDEEDEPPTGFGQPEGLEGLDSIEDITVVVMPDLMAAYEAGAIDLETVQATQVALIAHCEMMGDRMGLLDSPPGMSPQQVREWRSFTTVYDTKFAAMYYPWIRVLDPATGMVRLVPPSGHVAGVYARNDIERGVHCSPANLVVRGALGVELELAHVERDLLNPVGINAIVSRGEGVTVFGARTLSSEPMWRFIRRRRLMNYIGTSLRHGTGWALFDRADNVDAWQRILDEVDDFFFLLWRAGMLSGNAPEEAFYLKCDDETNPAESVDMGQIILEAGAALDGSATAQFRVVYACE